MRTRPLPLRKSHGTGYNLHPDTERVPAYALREGDVVLESYGHPAVITHIRGVHRLELRARYIWQQPHETPWTLGRYNAVRMFDRALPDEY